jgi:hypothetical protein
MTDPIIPARFRPAAVRRGMSRAYRRHAEVVRKRREHDDAMAHDPRWALEHHIQVAHSIDIGRGGCPYCAE